MDIAKNVMQVHWVDPESGEIVNRPVKRAAFLEYFANRKPCREAECRAAAHPIRQDLEHLAQTGAFM
ncbi:hypothetical protein [Paraburkholderia sp. RAU2J]|uniref:hypothetical protein n=1 Tax=Paraburkholderia sp. RAU2J TaxID=1938810 RepID=UPI0011C44976|nr:hypothetical protein [Paraburkholderia sp. RAU2J]